MHLKKVMLLFQHTNFIAHTLKCYFIHSKIPVINMIWYNHPQLNSRTSGIQTQDNMTVFVIACVYSVHSDTFQRKVTPAPLLPRNVKHVKYI